MDNHPIPQDVTGFQFRLIGSMTVKQFAYLAAGCGLAFLVYYLPIFTPIKFILIPLLAGIGFAIAFIPLEGRPLDAMIGFYLKALFSPNQYLYQKNSGHLSFNQSFQSASPIPVHLPIAVQKGVKKESAEMKKQKLKSYLNQTAHKSLSASDKTEEDFLSSVATQASDPLPAATATTLIMPQPIEEPVTPIEVHQPESKKEEKVIEEKSLEKTEPEKERESVKDKAIGVVEKKEGFKFTLPTIDIKLPSSLHIPLPHDLAPSVSEEEKAQLVKEQTELEKEEKRLEEMKKEVEEVQKQKEEELSHREEDAQKIHTESQMTHDKLLEMEKSLQDVLSQKQLLEQELQRMKEQLTKAPPTSPIFQPTQAQEKVIEKPRQKTHFVTQLSAELAKQRGLPATPDVPNILLGIVKDSSENILPNVLIEVKDKEGNPVRAFKTNQLGQFASATQLNNGTYTIDFEDSTGKHKFDTVELKVDGKILPPLEVISHDLREELRKQLFT